jgi:hypothetical protein
MLESEQSGHSLLHIVTTPIRWILGGVQAILLLLIIAGVCVIGSISHFMQGGVFDSFQFACGCWILGFLIMLFGAPLYTIFWGAVIYCSLFWWDINKSDSSSNLFVAVMWIYEGVGLLLVYAKVADWAKRRKKEPVRPVNAKNGSARRSVCTPHSQGLNDNTPTRDKRRATSKTSDDSFYANLESLIAAARVSDCKECEDSYRVLGVENGADAASVKDAYRDLAKVWHPDRFGDGDTRLKKKAEEQFKTIHAAYTHLQEHQPPSASDIDIEKMPLKEAVDCTTAAITEISRRQSLLLRWIKTTSLASRDDVRLAVGQSLAMAQDAVNRLQRLIRRFERELPDFPRSELESMLATCEVQRARLIEIAVRAELIQT